MTGEGPQTSEWIIWKGASVVCSTVAKGNLANYPKRYEEQLEFIKLETGKFWSRIILEIVRCGWPRWACLSAKDVDSMRRACFGGMEVGGITYSPLSL